jgi:ketosteroid isomerase-like protein
MNKVPIQILALALAGAAACQPAPRPLSPADEAAIRAADSTIIAALNAGNIEGATLGYTADGTVMPPNMPPAKGSDAIRQLWTGMLNMMNVSLTVTTERVGGEGNLAYHIASYTFSGTLKDSTHAAIPPEDGKLLQVWVRQPDGSWKAAAEAWNANAPPPPPPPSPARRR